MLLNRLSDCLIGRYIGVHFFFLIFTFHFDISSWYEKINNFQLTIKTIKRKTMEKKLCFCDKSVLRGIYIYFKHLARLV